VDHRLLFLKRKVFKRKQKFFLGKEKKKAKAFSW
jgi:hypothetical protein